MTIKAIQKLLNKAIQELNEGIQDGTIDPESIFVQQDDIIASRIQSSGEAVAHRHSVRINFMRYEEPDPELAGNTDQIDLFSE